MKFVFLCLVVLLGLQIQAQNVIESGIKVRGNCEECKARIERAADISGVSSVTWDIQSQIAIVVYNPKKTTLQKISLAITQAGHDTDSLRASDRVYKRLPDCCRYREKSCEKP